MVAGAFGCGLLLLGVCLAGTVSSRADAIPAGAVDNPAPGDNQPALTNALQVRQLALSDATRRPAVRLRGVVTFCHAAQNELFLQDATGGVLVRTGEGLPFEAGVGQLLEVEGETSAGLAATEVRAHRMALIGEGPMPPLCRVTEAQLAAGEPYGCWVEVRGVVHALQLGRADGLLGLELTTPRTAVRALIKDYNLEDCRRLVDAEVAIAGVLCRTKTAQPELRVPFMGDIGVTQPAPVDPFAMPAQRIHEIIDRNSPTESLHRVKVEGVVTLQQASRAVFIQSGTNYLVAYSEQKTPLLPGDVIEIAGFPARCGISRIRLEHAVFRKLGRGSPPLPIPIAVEEAVSPAREAALVVLEGTLLRRERSPASALQMQSATNFFRACLENPAGDFAADVPERSRLRLIGICLPLSSVSNPQPAFELLLRSPADVIVVKTAFLSSAYGRALLAAVAVLLAFFAACRLLRRKAGRL